MRIVAIVATAAIGITADSREVKESVHGVATIRSWAGLT